MKHLVCCAVLLTVVALAASPARAKDVYADQIWFRGDPNSTYQAWSYTTPVPVGIPPESFVNPYPPPPSCDLIADGAEWRPDWEAPPMLDDDPTLPGVPGWHMPNGGTTIYLLHNDPTPRATKVIIMQVTSSKAPLDVQLQLPGGITYKAIDVGLPTVAWGLPAPFDGEWATYVYAFDTSLNPEWESIQLWFPPCTTLDQTIIDTVCIPEPATLGLLAVGLAALRRRR